MNRHFEACVRAYICPLRLLWDCLRPKPYLEAEDDGPDEAEGEAVVAVDDVVGAHVLQVHLLLLEELQGLVHVLQAVDPHAALSGFRLREGEEEKGEVRAALTGHVSESPNAITELKMGV